MEKKFESAQEMLDTAKKYLERWVELEPTTAYRDLYPLEEETLFLLTRFMLRSDIPEYDGEDSLTPSLALDCLKRYKETGDIQEVRNACWYMMALQYWRSELDE